MDRQTHRKANSKMNETMHSQKKLNTSISNRSLNLDDLINSGLDDGQHLSSIMSPTSSTTSINISSQKKGGRQPIWTTQAHT